MKSPQQLADTLVRHWQRADWREQHLLRQREVWPLRLSIGEPAASSFRNDGAALRQHLQQWRTVVAGGLGEVVWTTRQYRSGAMPIDVPTHWVLRPSDCPRVFEQHGVGSGGVQASADYRALVNLLPLVDGRFHALLLRRLALWRHLDHALITTATRMALQLEPGCALGLPLRALAIAGNDSKFFERHAALLTALLDERFDSEASAQGLSAFLGAAPETEHWLLVVPLAQGLMPFRRQRVAASELHTTALPARRILLVENERCLHQLPLPIPDTIAILGAGLNLSWLSAPWLQTREVAYWGDMDTWGLTMLAMARCQLPQLQAWLMERTVFEAHQHLAVAEPTHAASSPPAGLQPEETSFYQYLQTLEKGRLEQEFIPQETVAFAVKAWCEKSSDPLN